MLFKDLIQLYISEILPRKRPKTQLNQRQQLDFWSKQLGDKNVADIKPVDIIQARSKLQISDASKNIYMAALRHVFSVAIRELDLLEANPTVKVKNLKNPRGRVRFLSDEERKNLLLACEESSNEYLYLVVLLAISTGARKNEILTLTWGDIDLEKRLIFLHETKNGEIRTCPIVPQVKELLIAKKQEISGARFLLSDCVFRTKRFSSKPMGIEYAFQEALKRARITNFRFHDLRHSCASYLAMNGASMNEIAEILGHKSLEMVKRYAHLSTAHKDSVVNKMWDKIKL